MTPCESADVLLTSSTRITEIKLFDILPDAVVCCERLDGCRQQLALVAVVRDQLGRH